MRVASPASAGAGLSGLAESSGHVGNGVSPFPVPAALSGDWGSGLPAVSRRVVL